MHKKSVLPVVAALVAFLSVSTMLRLPGLPVGIAEVMVFIAAFALVRRSGFLQKLKHPLMLFWAAFIVTALIGYFTGSVRGEGSIHTGVAYVYAACFTLLVLTYVSDLSAFEFQRFIRAIVTIPILLLSIPLLVFLIGSVSISDLLEINTQYYPSRVAAWSMNPNQLALFLLPVPIWLAAISQRTHWQGWRFFKKFAFLWLFFFLGFCVRSDALLLAWCIGIPLLTLLSWCWLKNINWRFFATMIAAFVLAFAFFKFLFDGPGVQILEALRIDVSKFVGASGSVGEGSRAPFAFGRSDSTFGIGLDPNKGGVRKTLWIHAFEVWKLSPVFGHGPGAFSYLDTPSKRFEAHNLLFDLLTQVGVVGVVLFGVLYLWLVIGAIKARDPFSITLLFVLMVFSGAHFMLRQPVFMLYMVICAVVIKNRLFDQMSDSTDKTKVLESESPGP
ncbi:MULTISPECIES: O-antigen ligase family protein [unclassified Pseudomonas]|uniref:O-antigen ligase family protein n=1 Tax=unclassified Pseudomonas TaxID=196821 RepID=UPI001CBC4894|nr:MULTISPECIES: O-antigen ligase family protein [unclassified Pseudomonas]